ncbi:glycerol-3-phosphate dehydrogenase/oxidase [Propioniferax innocua]|uniref:Glycerol-3-phosphate dehydrogenase n=1 Tax=Propioniferax innocua TaxID=1753 RepID=A0A542ZQC1_9ACTN|nr:glycerol-3-phosphate dehydrogenase/oxidase [Propioniferax innocua]TQL62476.1 glycerol-3-phosphate dehydrogenase [Propioniferax innocua]
MSVLNQLQRGQDLEAMREQTHDILVIGGGVTGAGVALDAASRGLSTAIVEAQDWASGTSSRSSRLVHGGLRYLYQLDFKLVAEALHERALLLTTLAPHLVQAQPFLWPLKMPIIERTYSAIGVGMYDALAVAGAGGRKSVPIQKHLSRKQTKQAFPAIDDHSLVGAIRFFDARVDDARLVITLVRTAVRFGARAASRTQVVEMLQEGDRICGARVRDLETGQEFDVRARHVINATGVWTEKTQNLASSGGGLKVLASKGSHIVVPRDRIKADAGMFLRTEKSVLFIIPWQRYWVIGTTDTAWHEQLKHPVPTRADIDYILEHANSVLADPLTHDDIIGTYAGLRPLLQPEVLDETKSTKVSREHTVAEVAPGMTAIAGGKLTTYRVMAADAVDFALGDRADSLPSVTDRTPLLGADGYQATLRRAPHLMEQYGWDASRTEHLLDRYGSLITDLTALIDEQPELGEPLETAPDFLKAEVVMACRDEGALHLEDILYARIRLNSETRDRGESAVDEIGRIAAEILGWDDARLETEKRNYLTRIAAERAAELESTDAAASQARLEATDIVGDFD